MPRYTEEQVKERLRMLRGSKTEEEKRLEAEYAGVESPKFTESEITGAELIGQSVGDIGASYLRGLGDEERAAEYRKELAQAGGVLGKKERERQAAKERISKMMSDKRAQRLKEGSAAMKDLREEGAEKRAEKTLDLSKERLKLAQKQDERTGRQFETQQAKRERLTAFGQKEVPAEIRESLRVPEDVKTWEQLKEVVKLLPTSKQNTAKRKVEEILGPDGKRVFADFVETPTGFVSEKYGRLEGQIAGTGAQGLAESQYYRDKRVDALQGEIQKDKKLNSYTEVLGKASNLNSLIDMSAKGNQAAMSAIGPQMARQIAGEVGAMSNLDVSGWTGGVAILRKVKGLWDRWANGELNENQKDDLLELTKTTMENVEKLHEEQLNRYKRRAKTFRRMDEREAEELVSPFRYIKPKVETTPEAPVTPQQPEPTQETPRQRLERLRKLKRMRELQMKAKGGQ